MFTLHDYFVLRIFLSLSAVALSYFACPVYGEHYNPWVGILQSP
jgi:hypothetical protein